MTELMKRYETETGEKAIDMYTEYATDDFIRWTTILIDILETRCAELKEENKDLKKQLTWRPVSEKPEKAGLYFVEANPYTGCESKTITTAYFDGESFLWHAVGRWLPIPEEGV